MTHQLCSQVALGSLKMLYGPFLNGVGKRKEDLAGFPGPISASARGGPVLTV